LQRYWNGQGDLVWQIVDDLGWRRYGALPCCDGGERLQELGVAIVLASGGLREGLAACGEVGGELGAIAAIGAPGVEDNGG
jgi:hypothetical protein